MWSVSSALSGLENSTSTKSQFCFSDSHLAHIYSLQFVSSHGFEKNQQGAEGHCQRSPRPMLSRSRRRRSVPLAGNDPW
jgi:hypothetical protein